MEEHSLAAVFKVPADVLNGGCSEFSAAVNTERVTMQSFASGVAFGM